MSTSTPATLRVTASGPSTALAYLQTLFHKALHLIATGRLQSVRAVLRGRHLSRSVSIITLTALGSHPGQVALQCAASSAFRLARSGTAVGIRAMTAGWRAATGAVLALATRVSPQMADRLRSDVLAVEFTVGRAAQVVSSAWHHTATRLSAGRPAVESATAIAARTTSLLLGAHALTRGSAASCLVRSLPATMTAVAWILNPWNALKTVLAVMATTMAVTVVRPPRLTGTSMTDAGDTSPETTPASTSDDPCARIRVTIAANGSVDVHGVPASLPKAARRRIADAAADAATDVIRQSLRTGTRPTVADRRVVDDAARAAARAELACSTHQ